MVLPSHFNPADIQTHRIQQIEEAIVGADGDPYCSLIYGRIRTDNRS